MIRLIYHRLCNLCWGAWQASAALAREEGRSAAGIYFDFLHAYCIARIQLSRYVELRRNAPDIAHRDETIQAAIRKWRFMRNWEAEYRRNYRFLAKYASLSYEGSVRKKRMMLNAYAKRYNMGKDCWVQYGVMIVKEHYSDGTIRIGDRVLLARDCDIDFTGDIGIGNDVGILEGVKILTHMHDTMSAEDPALYIPGSNKVVKTPLKIGDNVTICVRAIILPGVKEIGANSRIQAGAIVSRPVPPNTLVRADGKCIRIPSWVVRGKH